MKSAARISSYASLCALRAGHALKSGYLLMAICVLIAGLTLPSTATAQNAPTSTSAAAPLVTRAVGESKLVTLPGTVHPLAQARFDQGVVPDSFAANRMLLMLNRPPDREAALRQFLADVHNRGSATFHHWVTPTQFGERFGPADSDIQAASQWLTSHGFTVARVTKSKSLIEFSGTAADVREAFHSQIHQYSVNGEVHYANAANLAIPEALAPLVRGVSPINNFYPHPALQSVGAASYSPSTGKATLFTNPNGLTEFFAVAPEDFTTQYDLAPLYNSTVNGSGQTIGILNRSNIDVSLANAFRTLFNLSANAPQVVIDGDDPGVIADSIEAYLDVELSGAVAPNATVNLYIADGSNVQDPLALAALRAIEDNQASVLSASYGECEFELGETGNQMWSSLWEQAAAQGQTVFVSSGDSGPAMCPNLEIDSGGIITNSGLGVNGLASSPWNVAVGGTDFFYPDYASGAPSAPTFWNQINDSSLGSLKAPLPEQPWGNALGLNAISYFAFDTDIEIPSPAGGGGVSNCSQSSFSASGFTCLSGYPKPSWQNAPGVPSDGARDLPDLSLFAANGQNFSAYPICAQPGDCTAGSGDQSTVFLVGGTSASSPAMAGIMALVNQKFGRQGQADFTLYALARQQPSVFHDIAIGTNDVACFSGTLDCNTPLPNPIFPNLMSYGVYAAGPGYDEASGLGSVDADALVSNWNKISFLPTATTLLLSPTTVVHGTPVTFTASVSSGSGTPTGDVDIATTSTLPLQQSGAVPLAAGIANESVNFFPGGSYQVTAQYAGDGVFAPSASAPASLTVTPEPSVVTPIVSYPAGGDIQSGEQVPFGSHWTFQAEPSGASGEPGGLATGAVTFTDGTTSTQVEIGAAGIAAVVVPSLAVGQHSVSVSYSGDASFNPSAGGPLTFTVVQGNPRIVLDPNIQVGLMLNGAPVPIPIGTNLTVGILVGSGYGVAPTGNISVTLGAMTQTVALAPVLVEGQVEASAQVTFANLQAGSFALSANYPGDADWNAASYINPNALVVGSSTAVPTTTSLTVSPASANTLANLTFVVTVQAANSTQGSPFGIVTLLANGVLLSGELSQSVTATTATATFVLPGSQLPNGTDQITAEYQGLAEFLGPSSSAPVTVTITPTDFGMFVDGTQLVVNSGQSGAANISLSAVDGSAVSVTLSCAPSSASITCGVSPSTPKVPNTATLTIDAYVLETPNPQVANSSGVPTIGFSRGVPPGAIGAVGPSVTGLLARGAIGVSARAVIGALSLVFLLALCRAPRRIPARMRWALGLHLFAFMLLVNGCGGGGSSIVTPPPPTKVDAPAGTYTVMVSGTANGIVHNTKLTVIVQ